jgi:hypothetical protein
MDYQNHDLHKVIKKNWKEVNALKETLKDVSLSELQSVIDREDPETREYFLKCLERLKNTSALDAVFF